MIFNDPIIPQYLLRVVKGMEMEHRLKVFRFVDRGLWLA